MSKTKNVVIDRINEENERKQQAQQRISDSRRLSFETASQLTSAIVKAMDEIKGDRENKEAILQSPLFCDLFMLESLSFDRELKVERNKQQYQNMKAFDLVKELYHRMQMYHHYGECKGRELKGIAWHIDDHDVFAILLRDCAVNMEHSIRERLDDERDIVGTLFCIGYDPDIDCETPGTPDYEHYERALSFCADFKQYSCDEHDCHDVPIDYGWRHLDMLRDTLAQLDVISDIANASSVAGASSPETAE